MGAFLLAEFARQRHGAEAAVAQPRQQVVHVGAGLAEDDRGLGLGQAQQVEDRVLAVARGHADRAIGDVAVLAGLALRHKPQRVALEGLGKLLDRGRDGGREHQCAPVGGRRAKDELEIVAEAEVQHLVGLVQDAGAYEGQVEAAAVDVVAQAAGGAHDDLRAADQRPALGPVVHAADAGRDLGPGVKPFQFARDLQRQFARGCDHQRGRQAGQGQGIAVQDVGGHRKAEGRGLARPGLRGHQQVAPRRLGREDGVLDGGQVVIAARRECGRQRRGNHPAEGRFGHVSCQCKGGCAHPCDGAIPLRQAPVARRPGHPVPKGPTRGRGPAMSRKPRQTMEKSRRSGKRAGPAGRLRAALPRPIASTCFTDCRICVTFAPV